MDAENDCVSRGGHLASIHSKEENDFITDEISKRENWYWWFGGVRKNNTFVWSAGTKMEYTLLFNDRLKDDSLTYPYICKIKDVETLATTLPPKTNVTLKHTTMSVATSSKETPELDVRSTFKKHPQSKYSFKTGGAFEINGCVLQTNIALTEPYQIFYLFNSIEKILITLPVSLVQISASLSDLVFPPYQRNTSSYEDQGFYQCGFTVGNRSTILSNSIDVQFTDVASAKMNVRLDQEWNENLKNTSSENFKALEKEFIDDVMKMLPEENGVKPMVRIIGFRKGSVIADVQILYPNVTQTSRRQKCKELEKVLEDEVKKSLTFKVTNVDVSSLDCCPENEIGEEPFKGVDQFNETLVFQTITNNCTYKQSASNERQCHGNMKDGPRWSNVNLQNCPAKSPITNSLISLSLTKICTPTTFIDCQTPVEVSGNLSQLINQTDSITTRQDLEYISIVLQNLALHPTAFLLENADDAKTIVENVLLTISNVIGSNRTIVAQAQKAKQTSATILHFLDILAQRIGEIAAKLNFNKTIKMIFKEQNIALVVLYSKPRQLEVIGGATSSQTMNLDIFSSHRKILGSLINNKTLATAKIPKEAFKNKSRIVYALLFNNDALFQTENQTIAVQSGQPILSPISSKILAVTVGKEKVVNLSNPILLKFKKMDIGVTKDERKIYKYSCVFWDTQKETPPKSTNGPPKSTNGFWSSRGCWKVNETQSDITCECNHLTNFAILLDVTGKQSNPLELRIITWIGCGISLLGLFLTLLTYSIFKKLRAKLPPKILMSLASSLSILLIVFLVGAERGSVVRSKLGCQIVAGILHYFMLTTFLWMLIEAINLYRNFVKIFRSGGDGKFFKNSSRIAWGVPLLIVVINGAVKPGSLGNDQFCVILGNSFYLALLLPVALILFINFIVLIMVLRSLSKNQGSKITSTQKQSLATQTRITLACATLLGLTWLFAILAVGDLSYTFQLLFTIFNSLQGFFIFVFYTLRNQDVRNEWKRVLRSNQKLIIVASSTQLSDSTLNKVKKTGNKNENMKVFGNSDIPSSSEEIDLSSSTGHLIKQRQHYSNQTTHFELEKNFKKE
ncbi:adhesion G-protein coupled receptor G7-like [Clytia hemisphaerica]|uniref:Uncharacterized protein n=1 Tax=Clytia hemisphaerica TaxID=252671 RepID=A0A7M5UY88_9CNID